MPPYVQAELVLVPELELVLVLVLVLVVLLVLLLVALLVLVLVLVLELVLVAVLVLVLVPVLVVDGLAHGPKPVVAGSTLSEYDTSWMPRTRSSISEDASVMVMRSVLEGGKNDDSCALPTTGKPARSTLMYRSASPIRFVRLSVTVQSVPGQIAAVKYAYPNCAGKVGKVPVTATPISSTAAARTVTVSPTKAASSMAAAVTRSMAEFRINGLK
jgi:hypothetical protein